MRILILGAAGFLGSRLASELAGAGQLHGRPITELVLCDARRAAQPATAACPVTLLQGDLRNPALLPALFAQPFDLVFHLAAALTLDAEMDFRQGLEVNVLALIDLLEHCRAQPRPAMLLFASSISTYGGALPDVVDDFVHQAPRTSYGAHKAVAEHLIGDSARRGFLDGRILRLPIVLTHPGPATGSISDQVAALVREPLRGLPATCHMAPDSRLAVASVDKVAASFVALAGLPRQALDGVHVMNLPALTVTPATLVAAVERQAPGATRLVRWEPDAAVQEIIDSWPRVFTSARALALGFTPDASVDALVQAHCASVAGATP